MSGDYHQDESLLVADSACSLSGDELMLERAKDLAEWLLPAFSTSSGWPIPFYKLGLNPAGSAAPRILVRLVAVH